MRKKATFAALYHQSIIVMQRFTKAIAAIMLIISVLSVVGCTKPEGSNGGDNGDNNGVNNGIGAFNGHEYVDLGLPSGTLWATCNVGANKPEDYGDYYAWGEIQTKTNYDLNNYLYFTSADLTKYCNNPEFGFNGFTDNLIVLQTIDDAASARWGSGWCIPTHEQWEELKDNTTITLVSQNGVSGHLITASNGTSLFLPSAGYKSVNGIIGADSFGAYWSSSLYLEYPDFAWIISSFSGGISVYGNRRYDGQSVRAVLNRN